MTEIYKGIIIITNHFKDQIDPPKIVYANKYFLSLLGVGLEKIVNQNPHDVFANWDNKTFIKEIISCVEQKTNWVGELDVYTDAKKEKTEKKNFIITPVYDISGNISYYSCTTDVEKTCTGNTDNNLVCLNDFVDSLWQFQTHYESNAEKKRDLTKKLMALKGM